MAINEEYLIQKAIAKYLDARRVLFCSSIAGVKVPMKVMIKLVASGYRKGVPDITIYEKRNGFAGFCLEVKAPNRKPTDEQIEWQAKLTARGYKAVICPQLKTSRECYDWCIKEIDKYFGW